MTAKDFTLERKLLDFVKKVEAKNESSKGPLPNFDPYWMPFLPLLEGEPFKGHLTSSSYTSMSWTTFGWPWHAFNNWISREVSMRRLMIFTAYSTLVTLWMHFLTKKKKKNHSESGLRQHNEWVMSWNENFTRRTGLQKIGCLLVEGKKCPWIGFSASQKMEWSESIHLTSQIKMSRHPNAIPSKTGAKRKEVPYSHRSWLFPKGFWERYNLWQRPAYTA